MRLEVTDVRTLTDQRPDVRELQFRNVPVTVGSGSNNLVQLPDLSVAVHHATLLPAGEHWVYEPTVRDAATRLNGEAIEGKAELRDGDVIEIQHFTLKVLLDSELQVEVTEGASSGDLAKIRQFPLPPRSVARKQDAPVSLTAARQTALAGLMMSLRGCNTLAALLEGLVDGLLREFTARSAWIGVRSGGGGELEFIEGRTDQGVRLDAPPKFDTFVYRCLARSQFISIPRTGEADTQSVLAIPILSSHLSSQGAIGLIHVDSKKHMRVYDEADLDFLSLVGAMVAPMLEKLLVGEVAGPAPGRPTSAGSADPASLVPLVRHECYVETPPQWPGMQVAVLSRDGKDSAGDLCDVMKLPNGLAAFLLAHVEGDSARTAAAIAQLRGAFRVAGLHADPPHVQLKAFNYLLFDEKAPCRADVAVLVVNPKTGAMEAAAAGKLGMLLIDAQGQPRRLGGVAAAPVGAAKTMECAATPDRIDEGHTLALFSRGCIKAVDTAGTALGEKRFLAALCGTAGQPASQAMEDLLTDTHGFLVAGAFPDDATLLLAYRTPS